MRSVPQRLLGHLLQDGSESSYGNKENDYERKWRTKDFDKEASRHFGKTAMRNFNARW